MPAVAAYYGCASGAILAAGRFYTNSYAALMGDSLTDDLYNLTPFYIGNGANGGKLKLLANCGVSGQTVSQMLSRVNNLYTDSLPGFAGIAASVGEASIGYAVVRCGTNNIRGGGTFPTATATSLFEALAGYAKRVIILSLPPVSNTTGNTNSIAANTWLASFAAANPAKYLFVNDSAALRNPDGTQIASYFVDDVHLNHSGVAVCGVALAAALASELASKASPLSADPADVYPAQNQWFTNPTMIGSNSVATGVLANGVGLENSGITVVTSKVAADAGDPNQTPWQRYAPSAATGPGTMQTWLAMSGRAMSSSVPAAIDVLVEIRLTNLDTTKMPSARAYIQANTSEFIVPEIQLDFEPSSSLTKRYVLRNNRKRAGSTSPTSLSFYLNFPVAAAFSGGTGTIDFRCITARG